MSPPEENILPLRKLFTTLKELGTTFVWGGNMMSIMGANSHARIFIDVAKEKDFDLGGERELRSQEAFSKMSSRDRAAVRFKAGNELSRSGEKMTTRGMLNRVSRMKSVEGLAATPGAFQEEPEGKIRGGVRRKKKRKK